MTSSPEASGVIKDIAIVMAPAPSAPKHCNAVAFREGWASWNQAEVLRSDRHSNTFGFSYICSDKDQVKQQQAFSRQVMAAC